ncbi:alpha/beta hydrolase [Agromyces seonyuensis]|uniref:alpha/beta hydrolase n=1 Tax=Agromyces seonyuensis TaxID=2662446 RepID=UPI001921B8FF
MTPQDGSAQTGVRREYLILHGFENERPEGHWQRWLADELGAEGHGVHYPQLPEPYAPVPADWAAAIEAELDGTDPDAVVVVAHSLGCVAWIDYARRHAERAASEGGDAKLAHRVLLVSPPSSKVLASIPALEAFVIDAPAAIVADALAATSTERAHLVVGEADPYTPEGIEVAYADPYDLEVSVVPGGGHLTMDDGFGPLPIVLELATA